MRFHGPKHSPCAAKGPDAELFIVEGDSAASTVAQVRDPAFQALFAMQGKPMNAHKNSAQQLEANVQFAGLLRALGVRLARGAPASGPGVARPPYGKVVLLFDPDADGIHARTLMLFFFHRWMPNWLAEGRVFDAHAPQWEITWKGMSRPAFAATPAHMRQVRDDLAGQGAQDLKWKRYRGLGSMDGSIVREQCVHPKTRTLHPLTAGHADQALAMFEAMREL